MINNKQTTKQKIKNFLKRNSYALVVAGSALVLAVALAVTAFTSAKINANKNKEESNLNIEEIIQNEEAQASSTAPVVFVYPVKDYTLGNTYTDSDMVYNETLNEYSTHTGIDFIVADGTEVVACLNGTVESVKFDTLTGTTIVIDHGSGLKTSYMSLSSEVGVKEGDTVQTGQVIGKASSSAGNESALGAHVHLEASENGVAINPMTYLGEK